MLKRLLVALMAFKASPLSAADAHGCLGHHWEIPAYRLEVRWQLAVFITVLLVFGLYRGMRWLKKRTA